MHVCVCVCVCVCVHFVCVCVCVCVCTLCVCVCARGGVCAYVASTINEGKGRLKSWTLCDGLSEGVMGQGLAALPPPPPRPLPAPWCHGATEGLGVRGRVTSLLALPCAKTGAPPPPLVRRGWTRRLLAACAGDCPAPTVGSCGRPMPYALCGRPPVI